jgi:hypothetical protein
MINAVVANNDPRKTIFMTEISPAWTAWGARIARPKRCSVTNAGGGFRQQFADCRFATADCGISPET